MVKSQVEAKPVILHNILVTTINIYIYFFFAYEAYIPTMPICLSQKITKLRSCEGSMYSVVGIHYIYIYIYIHFESL